MTVSRLITWEVTLIGPYTFFIVAPEDISLDSLVSQAKLEWASADQWVGNRKRTDEEKMDVMARTNVTSVKADFRPVLVHSSFRHES